ncbi:hypothetical protein BDN70DRAFT_929403 [Pholiota conissans]|uniref:Uncharacterized protein n=1 Tax=Pholiota conissans TaxID=109636 RepID=A0A9P6CXR1_9AGAR|nr:hypothetical protein BDN70DRAFT_929403 [Pholiota conissans]
MTDCPGASPPMLNVDILYAIVDQLEDGHARATLQSMSCTSKLLAGICRGRIFKRVKLDIHDRGDIHLFSSILDRDPHVARAVRHLSITDNHPPSVPTKAVGEHQRVEEGSSTSLDVDVYAEVTQERSALSHVLWRLQNLSNIAVLFQYTFTSHIRAPLRWTDLSSAVRHVFWQEGLRTTRLEGIRCIPISTSRTLLSMDDLQLSKCTFTRSLADMDLQNKPRKQPLRAVMRRLSLEWLGMGEDMDMETECTAILGHWVYMDLKGIAQLPDIAQLSLSLGCWSSISEAGLFLNILQHTVHSLSIDTTGLRLEALRLLPLYQAAVDRTIRPLSTLDAKSILLLISQGVTTLADGWVTYDLHPVSLRHPSSPKVTSLALRAAYWATSTHRSGNGEMAWVCHMLADLSEERARAIDTLSLNIAIGGHFMAQDAAVGTIMRFAEDEMWCILNEVLAKEKWAGLRRLAITASVPPIAVYPNIKTLSVLVADHIHDNCLYDLSRRGILRIEVLSDV